MGLFGDMFKGLRMKDPVRGQAQVVSCSVWRGGSWSNCSLQLVVQAEGVPPTSMRKTDMVRADRWPMPGMTLPVTVDRAKPERVKIEWDDVESSRDRSERNAEALAATMRGEAPTGGFGGANVQVIDVSGRADDVDEQLARLAKLGQLRDAGVLTPEEFEQQKRRILEG